jgi:hypothetical protein
MLRELLQNAMILNNGCLNLSKRIKEHEEDFINSLFNN